MFSWRAPTLPRLPGRGPVVRVHDSAAQELRATGAGDSGRASLYVCGITPYDATHLGHAATYLAFDTLQRAWRDAGLDVRYVQNVTDVDEPLFERAKATGQDWSTLAEHETSRFRDDMAALRVIPPDHYVGAVEAMPQIVDLAVRLRDTGHTYELDGDVYFASSGPGAVESGRVAHLGSEEMLALSRERGGDPDRAGKKDPLDPLLWQAERPGEPGWDSPFGRGRPGWHVECAAIALHYLGPCIDVQGGGRDLAFPHHELGAAEAEAATGAVPFARAYVHSGMVGLHGEKMSKSRGNLVFVSVLRGAGVDPAAIRLALLAHHYRSDWDWQDADLLTAEDRLAGWRAGVERTSGPPGDLVLDAVRAALADDLQTPSALAAVDGWVRSASAGRGRDGEAPGLVRDVVDALLGVQL